MLTLEQVRTFCGTPTEVDGVLLSEAQANFLARSIGRLVEDAEHPFDRAQELSLKAFRSSFELDGGRWRARAEIPLQHGRGKVLRHCFNQPG
jgi:hypothetical protein